MSTTANPIGMNLTTNNYWSTEYPFIDRMKTSGKWAAQGTNVGAITLDANGYPTAMPSGASLLYTMVALDPAAANTSKIYELTYEGTATFQLPNTTIISSEPGKIVFQYNGASSMEQVIIRGIDAKDPLTEMHIVRQDQAAAFANGEIFNSAFLDKIDQFGTLRFMDWGATNHNTITSWSQRTTVDSASWATTTQNASVPIEVMVALANKTKNNMWIDIPAMADDNYVRQTLQYVKEHLDPSLQVNVEYSNEMWNWGFSQTKWAQNMANEMWGNGSTVQGGNLVYYGYRSAQIAKIAQEVFGADSSQYLGVLGSQTVNPGLNKYIEQGVAKANIGAISGLFDKLAITTYFGYAFEGRNETDKATILQWAKSGSAGLDAAFAAIKDGTGLSTTGGSLAYLVTYYQAHAKWAAANGLDLAAYEGGTHFSARAYAADDQSTIMDFFARLRGDPRMGDMYTQMAKDFTAAGGTDIMVYADAQSDRPQGLFGTLQSIYDDATPAFAALEALIANPGILGSIVKPVYDTTGGTTAGSIIVVPPASNGESDTQVSDKPETINTTQSVYKLADDEKNVTFTGTGRFTGIGNDLDNIITGSDGSDLLSGGGGNDRLIGGKGVDSLTGGTGADVFVFGTGDSGNTIQTADKILDFSKAEGDRIDLSAIDANSKTSTHDAFTFIDSAKFSGKAGELRQISMGGYWNISGDTDGDGVANFLILVSQKTTSALTAPDFILTPTNTEAKQADQIFYTASPLYKLDASQKNVTYNGSGTVNMTGNALDNILTGGNGNDILVGGAGNDILSGKDGNDILAGGDGNDRLVGGKGVDSLTGGKGTDIFVFGEGDTGNTLQTADKILDFLKSENDKIDLSAIDANKKTLANDAFTFIDSAKFSGKAGELRQIGMGGYWNISGDTDGDGSADFLILVSQKTTGALTVQDFIL